MRIQAVRFTPASMAVLLVVAMAPRPAEASDLSKAVLAGDVAAVQRAIDSGAPVEEDGLDGTPLDDAIIRGSLAIATMLIDAGANLEAATPEGGERPLHVAARVNKPDIIQLLAKNGADLEARDARGRTPLIVAVSNSHVEATATLLDLGCDPRGADDLWQDTPLHFSAVTGNVEIARLLLARKVDIDAISKTGDSPMHYAAMDGRSDMVRLLAKSGAKLEIRNNKGHTPSDEAQSAEMKDLLREIESAQ